MSKLALVLGGFGFLWGIFFSIAYLSPGIHGISPENIGSALWMSLSWIFLFILAIGLGTGIIYVMRLND